MKWLKRYRKRRLLGVAALVALVVGAICLNPASYEAVWEPAEAGVEAEGAAEAGGDVTGERRRRGWKQRGRLRLAGM